MPENATESGPSEKDYVKLPPRYASRDTGELNYTVTPGEQTHNLDLK
jgi:hypothetical protein